MSNSHDAVDRSFIEEKLAYRLSSETTMPQTPYTSSQSEDWWLVFNDRVLNSLVEQAGQNAFDVRRAISDVERAEAVVRGTRANLFPVLNGSLGNQADIAEVSQTDALLDDAKVTSGLSLTASWQLDLFGQTRKAVKAAQSDLVSSDEVRRDTSRLVISRTVQAYISCLSVTQRLVIAETNLHRLIENTSGIEKLMQAGYSTRLDLRRSETQIFELQANIAALKIQEATSRNALAFLTNLPPEDIAGRLKSARPGLAVPSEIPAPNLQTVITNRPDLRAAEWALFSASYGKDSAVAALYPTISFDASLLSNAVAVGSLPDLGTLSGNLASNIAGPLLGRGRLLAHIEMKSADVDRALINYEAAVMQAVLDIDNGLTRWHQANNRLVYKQRSLASAVEAQQLAERLFYAGELDFTSVIVAEQSRLQAEDTFLVAQTEALSAYVDYVSAVVPMW